MNAKKSPPSREQLAALASKLKDAPTIGNAAQMELWVSVGKADGWAAMSQSQKDDYRTRHDALK